MAYEIQSGPRAVSTEASAGTMTYEEFLNWPGDNHHVECHQAIGSAFEHIDPQKERLRWSYHGDAHA